MNIYFKDEKLFKKLLSKTILKVEVGSQVYGLGEDAIPSFVHIYATSKSELYSFLNSYYTFQYESEKENLIFMNIHTFIRNLVTGEYTINFEAIHDKSLAGTELDFLYQNRAQFASYTVLKSYLNFAKVNSKKIQSEKEGDKWSFQLIEILRNLRFAESIIDNKFVLNNSSLIEEANEIKAAKFRYNKARLEDIKIEIDYRRIKANDLLSSKSVTRFLSEDFQYKLDKWLLELTESKCNWELDKSEMSYIYKAFEDNMASSEQ